MSYSPMNYNDIPPRIGVYAVAKFLDTAKNQLCLERFGMTTVLPKKKGLVVKWRRPVPFAVVDTAISEGVTPAPQFLQYEDVQVSVQQYGGWVPLTDVILDTHEDDNLNAIVEQLGEQAAATKEAIIWGVIKGGTAVIYSGAATSTLTVAAPLNADDVQFAVRELKGNHATMLTKRLDGSSNFGSSAVGASFVLVGHTNAEADFVNMDGFVSIENYGSFKPIHDNEIGKVRSARIILTPHLEPAFGAGSTSISGVLSNGTAVDVYSSVLLGKDCFAVVPLAGMNSAKIVIKNPTETYEDPLAQRGFISWRMWYAAKILNDAWMIRIEHAVSAL